MHSTVSEVIPSLVEREEILARYQAGKFLEAVKLLPPREQLARLGTAQDLILAGRVMQHLGAWKISRALMLLATRRWPRSLEAACFAAFYMPRRSLWDTWRQFHEPTVWEDSTPEAESRAWTVKARTAAILRDFSAAEAALAEAEKCTPQHPWVAATRAEVLELGDRYEEALEWADEGIRRHPASVPARSRRAGLLTLLNRNEEALACLRESCARSNSILLHFSLINLLGEFRKWDEALAALDATAVFDPWKDRFFRKWQQERRCDFLSFRGEIAAAIGQVADSTNPYYRKLRENLRAAPPDGRRVELNVPFVRQKHLTCVPATLSALARFWQRPVRQEDISEEICYDGTPHSAERGWAERHGWQTREFTLNWESARGLLERGVPFALTTTFAQGGHMQAVIGYDSRRGTFLVRDPHQPMTTDWLAKGTLELHGAHGPRALIILPPEEAGRLEGLELAEAAWWDELYRMQSALLKHRREEAGRAYATLEKSAPGEAITLRARLALTSYDRQIHASMEVVEQLLQRFPKDGHYRLRKVLLLRQLDRHREAHEVLEQYVQEGDGNPAWMQQLADECLRDHRRLPEAGKLRRRLLRIGPQAPDYYVVAGREASAEQQPEAAVEFYRVAACLGDMREDLAGQYFQLASCTRQREVALRFLAQRDERLRPRSRAPFLTRFRALRSSGQTRAARELLDGVLAAYPEDGQVRLLAAEQCAQRGDFVAADEHLAQARGRVAEIQWLELSAVLCEMRGDVAGSIVSVQTALEQSPDNEALLRRLTGLVARRETVGRAAEVAGEWVGRYPHHFGFRAIYLDLLRQSATRERAEAIADFAAQNPGNAWVEREWAIYYSEREEWDRAFEHLSAALALEPYFAFNQVLRARLRLRQGKRTEAHAAALAAVRLSVDAPGAVDLLLDTCENPGAQRETLHAILAEIARQVNQGSGILACGPHVSRLLTREGQKQVWETLHGERPDLWQCWSVRIGHHLQGRELDEALQLAVQAEERFPLLPGACWDRYLVHKMRGERAEQKAALERALAAHPRWGAAERELAILLRQEGDLAGARAVLQRAIFHDPLDFLNHGHLAELDLQEQRLGPAMAGIKQSLQLEAHYPWGVSTFLRLHDQPGRFAEAVAFFDSETSRRPGYFWPLMNLAQAHAYKANWPECLAVLERALAAGPDQVNALEMKMQALHMLGRSKEALAMADDPRLAYKARSQLGNRAAQIVMQQGNKPKAVELLRTALKDDEGNADAWKNLAECLIAQQQWAEALPAARHYVRLAPLFPQAQGVLGWVLLKLNQRAEAEVAFAAAWEGNPANQFAAYNLFLLRLNAKDPAPAEQLVAQFLRNPGGDFGRRCEVELQVRRGRMNEAWKALAALAAEPVTTAGQFEEAWKALLSAAKNRRGGRKDLFIKLQELAYNQEHLKPVVGVILAQLAAECGRSAKVMRWAVTKAAEWPTAKECLRCTLESWARKKKFARVSWFVWRHQALLRADDSLWGTVGFAYLTLGRARKMQGWMGDWAERGHLQPWMLSNMMIVATKRGQWGKLEALLTRAFALVPDHAQPHLLTYQGFVAKSPQAAADLLRRYLMTPEDPKSVFYMLLRKLAVVRLRVLSHAPLDKKLRRELWAQYGASLNGVRYTTKNTCFAASQRTLSALLQEEPSLMLRWGKKLSGFIKAGT